jgi:FMN phosphatase YigB (HAD superfamily)
MKLYIFDLDGTIADTDHVKLDYSNIRETRFYEGADTVLARLSGMKVLVTRGDLEIQRKKIELLDLKWLFSEIIICPTDEDKKWHFEHIFEKEKIAPHKGAEVWVIGNRPDEEIRFGKELGWKTVRLLQGKHKKIRPKDALETASYTIEDVRDLLDLDGFLD